MLRFIDTLRNDPFKPQNILWATSCTYNRYNIMYVVLGRKHSCFGVESSVVEVMYDLTLVESIFLLFFFRCSF